MQEQGIVLFRESEVKPMELEDARIGTKVLVRSDHKEPSRQGTVGTIRKRYGTPDYRVFDVSFPDGRAELFWDHQLDEVSESARRPEKRWWVFW